ncbi:MAG: hypothetical protein A2836_03050 [Candidatus Taylorbacteria bacterium RIFCSPHIGHO2_01_FULL_45_63]|uniref:Restriction endonuclease n=1 Tax=Candidatus Taylorbacteria bacterium RIFCSPHIGHO2_02_FULL_45_35 TaxID=1802311 RepID=A0A1G2MYC9_9BACT|nr:MAG: hypothetical protein A2836_03050 [Candidatus Taylorbacteria bacterium RIFCSPHIGHO2_01_FULL_45_63]OHA28022.1 MAG: hypothetical protein A3D56_00300 [Candidatus Taylorbacteria bacterium RIFCSPHIGHO2_02_FULL_45_35]
MKKSPIFYTDKYKEIEKKILSFLNAQKDFLSERSMNSPRAVGDAIESVISENFQTILGDVIKEYSSSFARRAMADLAFTDKDGFYYVVDVKTHRLDTKFNMPNLTSVERLSRFYEEDVNYFVLLKIDYQVEGTRVAIKHVTFAPIEFFNWDCLTLGALGWGQIQIANANTVNIAPKTSRKNWMLELCDTLLEFYPKEIGKIGERIDRFKQVRKFWEKKRD